jgi:hypothetical protein
MSCNGEWFNTFFKREQGTRGEKSLSGDVDGENSPSLKFTEMGMGISLPRGDGDGEITPDGNSLLPSLGSPMKRATCMSPLAMKKQPIVGCI